MSQARFEKVSKMVYVIPNFLFLHFGESFLKTQTKIPKLQMHENVHKMLMKTCFQSHFMEIFMSFYDEQLKQQICYSFTLLISYID